MNKEIRMDRLKGQTTLMGLWSFLFVVADAMSYAYFLTARILCTAMLLGHFVCVLRHWDILRKQLPILRPWEKALLVIVSALLIVGICCAVSQQWPLIIKGIIAGIGTIVLMRLRLIYSSFTGRKERT